MPAAPDGPQRLNIFVTVLNNSNRTGDKGGRLLIS